MNLNAFRMPEWYPKLYEHCFPTVFLELSAEELDALKQGQTEGETVEHLLPELKRVMSNFRGAKFFSVDVAAPTDTERFKLKRGAVHSAASAWKTLAESEKVRAAVEADLVSSICIRPFRRMQPAKEFRLFVRNGKLAGMSQYWLIRHFRRLPARLETYWEKASALIEEIADKLPMSDLTVDIYFMKSGEILIVDLNPWGPPTEPLMYNTWERDWREPGQCLIVPPPKTVTGNVNVHF